MNEKKPIFEQIAPNVFKLNKGIKLNPCNEAVDSPPPHGERDMFDPNNFAKGRAEYDANQTYWKEKREQEKREQEQNQQRKALEQEKTDAFDWAVKKLAQTWKEHQWKDEKKMEDILQRDAAQERSNNTVQNILQYYRQTNVEERKINLVLKQILRKAKEQYYNQFPGSTRR
jgi:hypothetical protein